MTRDDLRAAVLLLVVAVNGFAAAPLARGANRSTLRTPLATDEFTRLQAAVASLGWHPEVEELADIAFAIAHFEAEARRIGLAPFHPWFRLTGTGQAWGMFTYPDRFPARLVVEGRPIGGRWTRHYASLDPEATFAREKFVYRRIRGVYDASSQRPSTTWDPFVSWVAAEVFRTNEDIDEVRVKFQVIRTYEPGEEATELREEGDRSARERRRP